MPLSGQGWKAHSGKKRKNEFQEIIRAKGILGLCMWFVFDPNRI